MNFLTFKYVDIKTLIVNIGYRFKNIIKMKNRRCSRIHYVSVGFIDEKGFTLIEIVVVMAIIAVLASLIVGAINVARHTATETANRSNARTIRSCLESYFAKFRAYCESGGSVSCSNQGFSTIASAMNNSGITCNLGTTSSLYGGGNVQGPYPYTSNFNAQGGELWIYNWDSTNPSMEKIPFP